MSALRLTARHEGLVQRAAPQRVEGWLSKHTGLEPPGGLVGHQVLAELFHLGYGLAWGALFGAVFGPRRDFVRAGVTFGLVQWAVGFAGYLPALRVTRPPHRAGMAENAVNLLAHAVYGVVTALFVHELTHQERSTSRGEWLHTRGRVG